MLRVRFAPSPTGYLHIGGARTALFNWLYARRQNGSFVLRIEDTDTERSSWEMVSGIVDGLRWLGLDWDEGPDVGGPYAPYFQSQRLDRARALAEQLVAAGRAYYCYCTADVLQQKRQAAEAAAGGWVYDRTCCTLSSADIASREAAATARAVRFKVPSGTTAFTDLVHGPIAFDNAHIEDFVILRSDRQPTYHLSVVADDIDMKITHVVRGDDHISNTPKQVLLYEALGASHPEFAHVPLILGPDKKRLSKRHGATSVMEYQRLGYLPEAMVNFLALLGWSPGDDRELFARDDLIRAFTLEGISGGNAVFNPEKLDWFNQQHILRLPLDELARRLEPVLHESGLWTADLLDGRRDWFMRLLVLIRPRVKKLDQFAEEMRPFLQRDVEYDSSAVAKHLTKAEVKDALASLADTLKGVVPFTSAELEPALRTFADARGVKAATLIHATRVAVTGRAVSPGLFDVLELLGPERVTARVRDAINFLPK
ncbi:MAG TPA: glutamate--tRNA ligase [Vicinamibacterales bacterium]|jgi:glutamyl-tRNA synthetase|nr:glutamate--tRNA ligase [Vicinamibacterales bacterium]